MSNNDNRDNDNRTSVLELPIVRQWLAKQRDNERQRALAELRRAADLIGEAERLLNIPGPSVLDAPRVEAYNLKNLLAVLIGEVERGK